MEINRFGLKRSQFTGRQKEYIRKRDGFGCVHCGRGLYTYEHFNPPFKHATSHNVDGIALLCGQCQLSTTKGILSKETIADDVQNPFCRRAGFQNDFFDLKAPCLIHFGNFQFYAVRGAGKNSILICGGEAILSFNDDPADGPLRLSAIFRDISGKVSLRIDSNEWKASVINWDIQQTANRLDIFHAQREIGIGIEVHPPHEINFKRFKTYFNHHRLSLEKDGLTITRPDGEELMMSTPYLVRRSAPIIMDF